MPANNLIVIMSDEHDPRYIGAAGDSFIQTPHLDALAARGTRFTQAVTTSPICVPARASFATGQLVHDIGYWDNAIAYDGAVPSWGHALQDAGITVESIGKLHYQNDEAPAGFDVEHIPMNLYNGHGMVWGSVRDPLPSMAPHGKRMLGDFIGPGESTYTRYDASVTARARAWLSAHAQSESPWCLFIGLVAPHFPLVVSQDYLDLYPLTTLPPRKLHPETGYQRHPWVQRAHDFLPSEDQFRNRDERDLAIACYLGLVSWMDANVGQIMTALDALSLTDSTRVIYTSDHGDNVGHRGLWGKSNFYAESVAVPMLMAGPDVPIGVVDTPVSLIDLYPTVLEAMGVPPPDDDLPRPGSSLFALASGPVQSDRPVFSEYHAVATESAGFMMRAGRWKYHHYVGYPPELFDLNDDPDELHDLGEDPGYAGVRRDMHGLLLDVCDPVTVDARAKAAQADLIERHGGRGNALSVGAPAATPPPGEKQT
ncbi:MAG: sulfatase-like hydrolase/transferase [Pseudomonadota bacterium]